MYVNNYLDIVFAHIFIITRKHLISDKLTIKKEIKKSLFFQFVETNFCVLIYTL